MEITVVEDNFTRKSGRVAFRSHLEGYPNDRSNSPSKSNFTLQSEGETRETHIWADKSVLGTGIGNSGMTNFPIEKGDSITVISEGEDRDNDGNAGIENEDEIGLVSKDGGVNAVVDILVVENDTVNSRWRGEKFNE